MCTNNSELTQSQQLLQNVQFDVIIQDQINHIETSGFVPVEVNVNKVIYAKMKEDFCSKSNIANPDDIQLLKYKGLSIRVQDYDQNFNNSSMGGWVFPIQVTMKLKEEEKIIHHLEETSHEEE